MPRETDTPWQLIENAILVNEGIMRNGALLIDPYGHIARIGRVGEISLPAQKGETLDAKGALLLPGAIDTHVHFRDPGFTHKGDIESESRAAVAGGVTAFIDMPNTKPTTTSIEALYEKLDSANGRAYANYAFYLGATGSNTQEISLANRPEIPAVKLFMGASTGNMQIEDPQQLEAIFRESPIPIATHCESNPIMEANLAKAKQQYADDIPFCEHPNIRSPQACLQSVKLAIDLATRHQKHLHILHISCREELEAIAKAKMYAPDLITAETCPHYLYFSSNDYDALQWRIKCNPAIKSPDDRDALRQALANGTIDTIGTDHAPHLMLEKQQPYLRSPSGIPSIQYALPLILELAYQGVISLPRAVQLTAHAPATLFDIQDRGFLREGYYADLVLVVPTDRSEPISITPNLSRCGWSPYDDFQTHFHIARTFVNGQTVYMDGMITAGPAGQPLAFRQH